MVQGRESGEQVGQARLSVLTPVGVGVGVQHLPGQQWGMRATQQRLCDDLSNVLMGLLGSSHPFGCVVER